MRLLVPVPRRNSLPYAPRAPEVGLNAAGSANLTQARLAEPSILVIPCQAQNDAQLAPLNSAAL